MEEEDYDYFGDVVDAAISSGIGLARPIPTAALPRTASKMQRAIASARAAKAKLLEGIKGGVVAAAKSGDLALARNLPPQVVTATQRAVSRVTPYLRSTGSVVGRAMPYIGPALAGFELDYLLKNPNSLDEFRVEHEKQQERGWAGVPARTLSILANPVKTVAAVGEDIGGGLADVYLQNFRPDLLPENSAVDKSIARASEQNANEEALTAIIDRMLEEANAENSVDPLAQAYREVVASENEKKLKERFRLPTPILR